MGKCIYFLESAERLFNTRARVFLSRAYCKTLQKDSSSQNNKNNQREKISIHLQHYVL